MERDREHYQLQMLANKGKVGNLRNRLHNLSYQCANYMHIFLVQGLRPKTVR